MAMNYTPIPFEFLEEMEELSDAEYGRLVRWGQHYHLTGEKSKLSGNERFYSKRMQMQIDRYVANYNDSVNSKRKAGEAGAQKRWQSHKENGDAISAIADDGKNGYTETKTKTNTETNTPTTTVVGSKKTRGARITPPTLDEVTAYVTEKGYHFSPEAFVAHYDSQGWKKNNGQKVTNWKQCCVTWETREPKGGRQPVTEMRDNAKTMDQLRRLRDKMTEPRDDSVAMAQIDRLMEKMGDG